MLGLSWPEILVIAAVAVFVIGPKELPVVMRALGRIVRRLQYIRFAFTQQFEDFMRTQELEELRNLNKNAPAFDEDAADEDYFSSVNFEQARHEMHAPDDKDAPQ